MSFDEQNTRSYKLCLIGDYRCGKTSYLNCLLNSELQTRYTPTLGVEVTPIKFDTNDGEILYSVWDTAGTKKFAGLKDAYYIESDAAIIFYDLSSKRTFNHVKKWINIFRKKCPDAKVIVVGNKSDIKDIEITKDYIGKSLVDTFYFEISVKTTFNIYEPLLKISKLLTENSDLKFIDEKPKISTNYNTL